MTAVVGFGLVPLVVTAAPAAAEDVVPVPSVAETDPGAHSGDSLDDPAIWVHPTDPSQSLLIVNDKLGSLDTYDLDGHLVQRLSDGSSFWGNVDVRQDVDLAGTRRDVVAVNHAGGVRVFEVDPVTRLLAPIHDGTFGGSAEGLCLYRSPVDDRLYAVTITLPGRLRQIELGDADADGLVDGVVRRDFELGSESEGCVAHDETGELYVSEEDVGLWRLEAEPDGGSVRTLVDPVAPTGHAAPDLEGLAVADAGAPGAFLLASAQNVADPGSSYVTVYDATDRNAHRSSFRVVDGTTSDDCDRTDGIAVTTEPLGPAYPQGLFVCQDNNNDLPGGSGNQDLKLVPLHDVVPLSTEPVNRAPVARAAVTCDGPVCTASATGSSDADGVVASYEWDFGAGAVATGEAAEHTYEAGGSHVVRLTVTDDDGAQDTRVQVVTTAGPPAAEVSFVAAARSTTTASARAFTATVPAQVTPGDGLLAVFATSTARLHTAPTGWTEVGSRVGGTSATTVWQRVADGTEAGQPLTLRTPTSVRGALAVLAYRGTSPQGPVEVHASAAPSGLTTSLITPTATARRADGWRVSAWAVKTSAALTLTTPAGEQVRARHVGSGSGAVSLAVTDSGGVVPRGTQGGLSAAVSPAVDKGSAWTLLLRTATPAENLVPQADFTHTCVALACTFDGTGSRDEDGSLTEHRWVFEDSVGATGATATHTFAGPGTHPVTLAVTDDRGATAEVTHEVVVSDTPPTPPPVTFVGSATSTATTAVRAFSATVPGGVRAGDGLLAVLGASAATGVVGPGTGWQLVGSRTASTATTYVWQRVAVTGSAGSVVRVEVPNYQRGVLSVLAYRGTSPLAPVTAHTSAGRTTLSTAHTTPTAVGPEGAARLSLWTAKSSAVTAWTPPAGETTRTLWVGAGDGRVSLLATDPGEPVAAGSHGGLVALTDALSDKVTTWTLLLGPGG